MGTNVYFYKKLLDEKTKEAICKQIKEGETLESIQTFIADLSYDSDYEDYKRIHIGKRSSGWKFLFARNVLDYCQPNKESICKWLSTGFLYDEYGERLTVRKFWKEFVEDFQDGMTGKDYEQRHPNENVYRWYDEVINGLRFTQDYTEFS